MSKLLSKRRNLKKEFQHTNFCPCSIFSKIILHIGNLISYSSNVDDVSKVVWDGIRKQQYRKRAQLSNQTHCPRNWRMGVGWIKEVSRIIKNGILYPKNVQDWLIQENYWMSYIHYELETYSRSRAEAEYRALALGNCEGIWIKRLLEELKVS